MADAVEAARARLDRALAELERKTRDLKASRSSSDDDLFAPREDAPSAARVAQLEAAGREASQALADAADQIRALSGEAG